MILTVLGFILVVAIACFFTAQALFVTVGSFMWGGKIPVFISIIVIALVCGAWYAAISAWYAAIKLWPFEIIIKTIS